MKNAVDQVRRIAAGVDCEGYDMKRLGILKTYVLGCHREGRQIFIFSEEGLAVIGETRVGMNLG